MNDARQQCDKRTGFQCAECVLGPALCSVSLLSVYFKVFPELLHNRPELERVWGDQPGLDIALQRCGVLN